MSGSTRSSPPSEHHAGDKITITYERHGEIHNARFEFHPRTVTGN